MSEPSPAPSKASPDVPATLSKSAAPKNKPCPFCGDQFTSSSLGRHLDLYIKVKNPKANDGVHDVDKIRLLRSNITRRQPRRSTRGTDPSTPVSNEFCPPRTADSPYSFVVGTDENKRYWINKPTWEATGVMTDIPSAGLRQDPGSRKQASRSEATMKKRMLEDRTRLRAAELALQEVLDSVNAASAQAHPPSPFPFDFLSLTFPALVLRLLPPQPTIASVQPLSSPAHCPISFPTKPHYTHLQILLTSRLAAFARTQSQLVSRPDVHDLFSPQPGFTASLTAKPDPMQYHAHLAQAWDAWAAAPDRQKAELWHLETLRSLAAGREEVDELRERVANAEGQAAQLRLQIARLSACQQPKEYAYNIPAFHKMDVETSRWVMEGAARRSKRRRKGPVRGEGEGNAGRVGEGPGDVDGDEDDDMEEEGEGWPLDGEALIRRWIGAVERDRKDQRALPEGGLGDLGVPAIDGTGEMEVDVVENEEGRGRERERGGRREGEGCGNGNGNGELDGDEGGEADGDSVDAAGEDDDDVHITPAQQHLANGVDANSTSGAHRVPLKVSVGTGTLDRSVLDPSLRGGDGNGVGDIDADEGEDVGGMEVDGGDFGAEMLLANMRAMARSAR